MLSDCNLPRAIPRHAPSPYGSSWRCFQYSRQSKSDCRKHLSGWPSGVFADEIVKVQIGTTKKPMLSHPLMAEYPLGDILFLSDCSYIRFKNKLFNFLYAILYQNLTALSISEHLFTFYKLSCINRYPTPRRFSIWQEMPGTSSSFRRILFRQE